MRAWRRRLGRALLIVAAFAAVYATTAFTWAYLVTPRVVCEAMMREPPRLGDLPPGALEIVLRVENPGFYRHHGVDPFTPGQGLTTVSQALVKIFLLAERRRGLAGFVQRPFLFVWRHFKDIDGGRDLMALALNARVAKQTQLRLFLGNVYMGSHDGQQIIGLAAAARAYFGKELAALDRDEMIALTAMIIAPNDYHPERRPARHAERVARIHRLLDGGCAPKGLLDTALAGCAAGSE